MAKVADNMQQNANIDGAGSANEDLWRFAAAFYAQPGVAAALIALQDRDRLDVNLILFTLWHGVSGRGRLDRQQLAAAERAIRALRGEVIEPLRSLRRRLKANADPDIGRLREAIVALEIEAERAALYRLAASAAALPDAEPDRAACIAAARVNFLLCLGAAAIPAEAAIIHDRLAPFLCGG